MNKNKLFLETIEAPLDLMFLMISGICAYYLRFAQIITQYRPVIFELPFFLFFKILLGVSFFALFVFAISGVYSFKKRKLHEKISKVFFGCSIFILILIVAFFFNQRLFSSRFIVLSFWMFAIILLSFVRIVLNIIYRTMLSKGHFVSRIVVVGNDDNSYKLIGEFKRNKSLGTKVIENYDVLDNETIEKMEKLIAETSVDVVLLTDTHSDKVFINKLINLCNAKHIVYKYTASLLDTKMINFDINTISGIPIVEIKSTSLDGWARVWKRIFDIVVSFFGIIIMIPIYVVVGLFIKLDTKGPVLVRLERIGAKNKIFKLYKFRSMVVGADKMKKDLMQYNERNDGPLFKMERDPRITRIGRFIRTTSIDEIPNLINVFKGEMSLVGPRAHEPNEVEKYEDGHLKLLAIKPGITGMAQVSGRSDLKFEEEARLDIYYIENWSMWLDIAILIKTIKVVLTRKSAV